MDPFVIALLFLGLFFVFVFLGMPIGFTFAIVGFLGALTIRTPTQALNVLGLIPYSWGSSYTLVVIPLFILMGQFAFHSGISRDLYHAAYKWVGKYPGGLALATNLACTGFAAVSGSSLASAATMGIIAVPEMQAQKYSPRLASACVAAGGTLGILIPPSIIFVIYGMFTETSIGKLFIAGIIPGIMLSSCFMILIYAMCRRNLQLGPPGPHFPLKERMASLKGIWGMLALFFLVIGGIYFGVFTPTEAGAMGAFGAFMIALLRGRVTWAKLVPILRDTLKTTAMIFMIVIGAQIFNTYLTLSGVPKMIADWIAALPFPPLAILGMILLLYVPLGMVMDSLPMILLTLPTLFPVVVTLGFDPIHFGVLVTVMSELANISPPLGMNLYIVKAVSKNVTLEDVAIGIVPFAFVIIGFQVLLVFFPQISLFLPGLMK